MSRKLIGLWFLAALAIWGCAGQDKGEAVEASPVDTVEILQDSQAIFPPPELPPPPPPMSEFERTFRDSGLVDIQEFIPGILVELMYSTEDNFVETDVYGDLTKCFLRPEAAEKLKLAQTSLQEEYPELTLLVYDGTRPHRVQAHMWEVLDVPFKRNYLAPPWEGSIHNYGCAVDLTVANLEGEPLDMGTPFDFFGKLAQPQLEKRLLASGELTEAQHENRLILRKTMKAAGFYDIRTEWWHFNAFPSRTVKSRFTRIP